MVVAEAPLVEKEKAYSKGGVYPRSLRVRTDALTLWVPKELVQSVSTHFAQRVSLE
ncbi:MAG: hypothetical protein JRG73_12225 [Deltaproteobacteria bacterium]|nr:hypothetical protein [Deltaproteobacteria bacterium]MBW2307688.1 hypothetical protein [Deltaproteobacteria bacterium]